MISSRWLGHGLAPDHAGGDFFDLVGQLVVERTLAVDRFAQGVDHAAKQLGADRHFQNAAGTLDRVAFGNVFVLTQNHGADGVTLQVQGQAEGVVGEFQHFTLLHVGQPVDTGNAVGHGNHGAFVAGSGGQLQVLDPALDQIADFRGIEITHGVAPNSLGLWPGQPACRGRMRR